MALCSKGKELLRELQRSDWLPPFNVRDDECCAAPNGARVAYCGACTLRTG